MLPENSLFQKTDRKKRPLQLKKAEDADSFFYSYKIGQVPNALFHKFLCQPTAHGLVVELQAGVSDADIYCKHHNYNRPRLAKSVKLVLNQPSIEQIHNRVVYNVERIRNIA